MTCEINTKQNPCPNSPEVKARLLVDLQRPYFHIQGKDLKDDKVVVDQIINICTISKQPGLDLFVKPVFEMIKKNLNFELACPFKKVRRLIDCQSFTFTDSNLFQGFYESRSFHNSYGLLLNFFQLNQTQRYMATIKNRFAKTMENVLIYQLDFDVVETDD